MTYFEAKGTYQVALLSLTNDSRIWVISFQTDSHALRGSGVKVSRKPQQVCSSGALQFFGER